jgi:hypothetical protein
MAVLQCDYVKRLDGRDLPVCFGAARELNQEVHLAD